MADDLVRGSPRIREVYEQIQDLAQLAEYQKEFFRKHPEAFDDDE